MSVWQPGPRPPWVRALNGLGEPGWVGLEPSELLAEARTRTGLDDFGDDDWREGFEIFTRALEEEAQLTLVGRVLARSDVVNWLENRLAVADLFKRHPEIASVPVTRPLFITGLPRTGTSILHELLGQDPRARVPLAWEVRHPTPPPETATYETDERIARSDDEIRLWSEIVPEYDAMHELGARLPVECIQLTAHSFRSDELAGRHLVPSYSAWLAKADMRPAYAFHKRMLQVLEWRHPREYWVLKAPSHLGCLDALLHVYPDARVVQTHRDPLKVMASVASILFSTAWVRSDAVDAEQVLGWFTGETCQYLLDAADTARKAPGVSPHQFFDVLYADMMASPTKTLARLYAHFEIDWSPGIEARMRNYLAAKPKGKHGAHRYDFEHTGFDLARERQRFADYQRAYGVVSEMDA